MLGDRAGEIEIVYDLSASKNSSNPLLQTVEDGYVDVGALQVGIDGFYIGRFDYSIPTNFINYVIFSRKEISSISGDIITGIFDLPSSLLILATYLFIHHPYFLAHDHARNGG